MIDTYMDRCDAASGYRPEPAKSLIDDPRYFNGQLYETAIARNAAVARHNLAFVIDMLHEHHSFALFLAFRKLQHANRHLPH